MSDLRSKYSLDHEVFGGGRYLQAFSALEDIDHYELAILQYLGHRMPFHKGFVGKAAFPSVATMSVETKIAESTLRKKIKSLICKGYLIKKTRRVVNKFGRFEQSSNDYFLTDLAFDKYLGVIETQKQLTLIRKRAVGEHTPFPSERAPLTHEANTRATSGKGSLSEAEPNSQAKIPKEKLIDSFFEGEPYQPKSDVDEIIECWEKVIKKPVSPFEKQRFVSDYIKTRSNIVMMLEAIKETSKDPYLFERAKSINWLFRGFYAAKMNRSNIKQIAKRAIDSARSVDELECIASQLPKLTQKDSANSVEPTPAIVLSLFGKDMDRAKNRLGVTKKERLPQDLKSLFIAINHHLEKDSLSEKQRSRFKEILALAPTCSFAMLLDLYMKRLEEIEY